MTLETEKSSIVTDVIQAVAKRRKFVFTTFLSVTGITVLVVLLLPRWYASTTTILPPRASGLLGGVGEVSSVVKQFSALKSLTGQAGGGDLYNYVAILQSRPALQRMVYGFNLFETYDIKNKSIEDAVDVLRGNLEFLVNEEGTLTVRVYDRDPKQAAVMADSLVAILDEINISLSTRQAHSNRVFIERRVDQNRADLRLLEDTIKLFQEKHWIVIIPQETQSSIAGFSQLYGLKATKELQVGIMEQTMSSDNILLQSAKRELAEIERRLKGVPALGVAYYRLYRDYAVQQKIFEMLTPLYEQARVEEQRDTPTLLVLERGNVPERPARPQRKVIVLVFALLSLIVGVGGAYGQERIAYLKTHDPAAYGRIASVWGGLKRTFSFRRRSA